MVAYSAASTLRNQRESTVCYMTAYRTQGEGARKLNPETENAGTLVHRRMGSCFNCSVFYKSFIKINFKKLKLLKILEKCVDMFENILLVLCSYLHL